MMPLLFPNRIAGARLFLLPLVVLLAAMLSSCRPVTVAGDPVAIAQGRALYHALACDSCHGLDAVGSTRTYAPNHNHLRATAQQRIHAAGYTGQATSAIEYIRESIVAPELYLVDGYEHLRFGMPSFAHLSERDINALVQFLYAQE